MFLCFPGFEYLVNWFKYIFCLKDVGIFLSARIKIHIFEPFPTFSKVGVDQKVFIKYELLLKPQNCML